MRLAMIQFPTNNGHFIDFYHIGHLYLEKIQIKPFLPYMVPDGIEGRRVRLGNGLFGP